MTEEDRPKKKLSMFQRFTPQTQQRFMNQQQQHQVILKEFVRSKYWEAFRFEVAALLKSYETSPPTKLSLLIGYHTYSIIRDGFNQLIARIESEAQNAPDVGDYDG